MGVVTAFRICRQRAVMMLAWKKRKEWTPPQTADVIMEVIIVRILKAERVEAKNKYSGVLFMLVSFLPWRGYLECRYLEFLCRHYWIFLFIIIIFFILLISQTLWLPLPFFKVASGFSFLLYFVAFIYLFYFIFHFLRKVCNVFWNLIFPNFSLLHYNIINHTSAISF